MFAIAWWRLRFLIPPYCDGSRTCMFHSCKAVLLARLDGTSPHMPENIVIGLMSAAVLLALFTFTVCGFVWLVAFVSGTHFFQPSET